MFDGMIDIEEKINASAQDLVRRMCALGAPQ